MADIPATTPRSRAQNTDRQSLIRPSANAPIMSVADLPKQLQELLDEVVVVTPTLKERLENWGSD